MLETHIAYLFEELGLGSTPSFDPNGVLIFPLEGFDIHIVKQSLGVHIVSKLAPLPKKNQETFLLRLLQANFLGQGTGNNVLGLSDDETTLTLSLYLPEHTNLSTLKEGLEQIANYTSYWKDEITQHEAGN
ncbi:type III secretion system chaperone [Rhabdochlamydiaceae symbiont of Dictyostelium giganteum]|uniref:type III secretion system chaperone n=1 Tax=Rhabdochlamydiaceae symbiont of Dictyostelium giganteum TaxID=3342349 RepID=UPI00384E1F75